MAVRPRADVIRIGDEYALVTYSRLGRSMLSVYPDLATAENAARIYDRWYVPRAERQFNHHTFQG